MQGIAITGIIAHLPKIVMRSPDMPMPCIENAKYGNPQAI
jgi:hypothetical protein